MADSKISQLALVSALASGDFVPVKRADGSNGRFDLSGLAPSSAGRIKASAVVTLSGTTPSVAAGLNVASVVRTAAGRFRVTFATPLDSINYGFSGSARLGDFNDNWTTIIGIDRHAGYGLATTHVDINVTSGNGGSTAAGVAYDPLYFSFEIWDAAQQTGGGGVSGGHSTTEQATGQTWIDGKAIYRKVVDVGALPNTTTKTVAHGVTGVSKWLSHRGHAQAADGTALNLPLGDSAAGASIGLWLDATNINIRTGADRSGYSGFIILEYTKT
ncbi:hypothetical protein AA309_20270 [Microvirga vignae]|uniref:Uncharacterized protein n=1 Tax=Microvirga vignae TaxID=1225564 RepID=A0A0H1RFQ2_9HYPH|nr:hypothetical protein [Microvirga vignae]KLK91432.1 hypothetical protein AA309_20270 [Microvirga vignae]